MKNYYLFFMVLIVMSFSLFANWVGEQKVIASDGEAHDFFGSSVATSGDYAVIGAHGDEGGSAYIFHRSGNVWTEQAKLTASDGVADDIFGCSVSISGDYVVIGAKSDDDNGINSGSAYIFHRVGSTWTEQDKITASDGDEDDLFGESVSISSNYIAVGAKYADVSGVNVGSAYVFHREGSTWSEQAKLSASDASLYDHFGRSVSIDGDYVVVGSPDDDVSAGDSGSAYIFFRTGDSWLEQAKLIASDGAAYDDFGCSVSISGDSAIIGALGDNDNGNDSGSAYIFHRIGTSWTEQAKLTASDGEEYARFGDSVSISQDNVVVGAYSDDGSGTDSGSAYFFKRTGDTWSGQQKIISSDSSEFDYFGCSVCVSGDFALIGAGVDDDNGESSGSAYFYNSLNNWDGSASHNWSNSSNWSLDRVPDADEDVIIPAGTPNDPWVYVSDGTCQNLTVESGANLRIYDEQLEITNNVTIHGNLTMDDDAGVFTIGNDIVWESGSTADISAASAEIFVSGSWNFESGADVQMDNGYVEFYGSGTSWLRTKDADCYFYHLRNNKTSSILAHSGASTEALDIHGHLFIYSDSELQSATDENIVINGNINNMDGSIHLDDGTVMFEGGSSTSNFMPGDYFYDLTINSTGTETFDDDIHIKHDLLIASGILDPDDNTITIGSDAGGSWTNNVGDAGFIEGSGRVIFQSVNTGMTCFDETFNELEIDVNNVAFSVYGSSNSIICNSYDWTSGLLSIQSGATFTALDLADTSIYGKINIANSGSIVNLYQDAMSYIDLRGELNIHSDGVLNIYGGTDDSWWSYNSDASITMSGGILDFKDRGIKIHNGGFALTEDITGGTIRTSKGFTGDRMDFNPVGGTIELYSSSDISISHGAGSNFYDVNINKTGTRTNEDTEIHVDRNGREIRRDRSNSVYAFTDLDIDGDLLITEGTFDLNGHIVDVSQDVDIYGTLQMFNFADVLDSGRDIHWRSGSNSNITNGIINLDLVWFFHDGTNAQLGSNNEVHFDGSSMQEIYCWDEDAEFNDVFIDNTTMTVWFHSSGVDTIHVAGDMTITAGNDFYLRTCDLLVDGTLEIEDTATLYVNEIEGVGGSITNNSDFTLNGELNIDVEDAFIGGDVFINGDFSIAVTGLLAIDSGSFTIDNPVVGWESIWGTINMSDGLYFSNQGPSFQSTANTDISGGLIDVDHLSALNIGNFEPTGGTVEISHDDHYYGNISCSNGNYFHNLTISGFVDLDGGFLNTDIIVQNDLEIESGQLWFRGNEATVLNDVIISGGLKMLDPLDVLNAGDGSGDEIIWNAGSFSDQTSDGAINVYGNWTFEDGTDAQIGTGNTVNFVGGNNQLISCFDADADFGNVNCDQTAMSTWLHSSSTQPMRVSGDMTITAQSFHIQSEELIVDGTLDIQDGTLMDLGFSGSLTNNSDFVLNGELDVDAGDALIHGEFELAETGILTIDGGSFVSDAAYSRAWQPFNGTLNLSDGLLEITNNSVIIGIPFVDNITGGIFRIGASFSSTVLDAFQPAGGSLEMTTDQFSRYINCTNGSYLYDLIINTTETIAITADLIIQNNLEINSGGLYSNDLGISVGGDWTNNVGDDGFLEENGTVTFFGAGESDITTDETFYNLILDKTNPQFYALEIMDDITVNVLNDFDITDATLEMNNGSTLDIDNDLNISLDAGLNAFGEPGLNIFVGGDWNDDNDHHDSWIGFYYGTSTVTFDGDEDQILTSACAADSFYHVIIDKPAGHFRASNDTRIFGNLRIADGGWFDDENYLVHYLYGDFTVAAGAAWFGTTSNAVVFSGTADQEVSFDPPTTDGYFHDVYVDKTEETRRNSAPTGEELLFRQSRANRDDLRSDTVTLITDCSALGNGNLTLHEGILDLNGNDYLCTGNVSINNGGRLVLDDNSSLKVGNGYDLNVNDGGIFEIIGSAGNEATLSHHSGYYDVDIESGGTIRAEHAIFEYMSNAGVEIKDGALVDNGYQFINCTFREGSAGGSLLTIHNDMNLTIDYAVFPDNTWGSSYNVKKLIDAGEVTFTNASGDFAGPLYENDTYDRIHWDGFAPDLEVTNVIWSSTEPYSCDQITATVTVYNNGNLPLPVDYPFYIDIFYNPTNPPVFGEYGDQFVQINSGIPVGDFIEYEFYITHDLAETWNSYVLLDTDELVDELDEDNNLWGPDVINWNALPVIDDLTIQIVDEEVLLNWTYPIQVDFFNVYISDDPHDFSGATIETTGVNSYSEAVAGSMNYYYVTAVRDCSPSVVLGNGNKNVRKSKLSER